MGRGSVMEQGYAGCFKGVGGFSSLVCLGVMSGRVAYYYIFCVG